MRIVMPDGRDKKGIDDQAIQIAVPDSDSGIYHRGQDKAQVNIWRWPIGSGELYGYPPAPSMPPELRMGVTPSTNADLDIGKWYTFVITMRGDLLSVKLNGEQVLEDAQLPGVPPRGRLALQHHGSKDQQGNWQSPPSLVQFRNIRIGELD